MKPYFSEMEYSYILYNFIIICSSHLGTQLNIHNRGNQYFSYYDEIVQNIKILFTLKERMKINISAAKYEVQKNIIMLAEQITAE